MPHLHAAALQVIVIVMDAIRYDSQRAPVLFIADLHLDARRPEGIATFLRYLKTSAEGAAALFIIGDLFEAWIGDDACPPDDPIAPALNALARSGTDVWLMHGNRDFLIGPQFAHAAAATLLDEPACISIDTTPIVLEHGDALCTDDHDYQAFRTQVRNHAWQSQFLALPINERLQQASAARERSGDELASKAAAIMDVNQQAVEQRLRHYAVRHLIHGHTHRPGIHHFDLDGSTATRAVLGDWFEQGSVLRIDHGDWQLQSLPLETKPS